jgi:hypothetical protein
VIKAEHGIKEISGCSLATAPRARRPILKREQWQKRSKINGKGKALEGNKVTVLGSLVSGLLGKEHIRH